MMARKRKMMCVVLAVVATSFLPLLTSCETTRIEYVRDVPDVSFPIFPAPDGVTYDEESDTVTAPLDWYLRVAEYKIDVDAVEEYLRRLRKEIENAEVKK